MTEKTITLKVESVLVFRSNHGPDKVFVETSFPNPIVDSPVKENLSFTFIATRNTGEKYVREHFGIEPELVSNEFKVPKYGN